MSQKTREPKGPGGRGDASSVYNEAMPVFQHMALMALMALYGTHGTHGMWVHTACPAADLLGSSGLPSIEIMTEELRSTVPIATCHQLATKPAKLLAS